MLRRPRSEFASHTGRQSKESKELYFLLTPTDKNVHLTTGRGESTKDIRGLLKKSRDPKQLRQRFQKAVQESRIDASVVGAAMQRCGQGLWWKELLEIRESQEQMGIVLYCLEHSLLLHALASCLKCKRCSDSEMDVRKAHAFQLAQTIWGHPLPSTVHEFNCALSSVLQLCIRVGSSEAFAWADELWNWSEKQPFEKTVVTYAARLCVYEVQKRHAEVDNMLDWCARGKQELNSVVLGTLIQAAAASFDPERADSIWNAFVHKYQVKANFLAYTAYAKAHLLAGQPQNAVNIIDEMIQDRDSSMDYKLAIDYLQALLILYHSSLSSVHLTAIVQFLDKGATIVAGRSAKSGKTQWRCLQNLSQQLIARQQTLCLKELFISMNAKESVMASWENYQAGTNYLSSTRHLEGSAKL